MEYMFELVENKKYKKLQEVLKTMHEADIAKFLSGIDEKDAIIVFRLLAKETAAEVFSYLDLDEQLGLVNAIGYEKIMPLLHELHVDDKVDILEELPANAVKTILANSPEVERDLINRFLNYRDHTAGSIMTAEFVTLRAQMTVKQTIEYIRNDGMDKETIYHMYVVDNYKKLMGVVSLRDVVVAGPEDLIGDIMEKDVIYVYTDTDQEDVADEFSKYDFMVFPVVDMERRITGIVTYDDIMDVIEEEVTDDFYKMGSLTSSNTTYLKESAFKLAKDRLIWLVILMISGTLIGGIIEKYSFVLAQYMILSAFIPMITGASGNAGIQSSTIAVRNLALGEIEFKDIWKVGWKELKVGLIIGLIMGVFSFLKVILIDAVDIKIGFIVGTTLFISIILSKLFGALIPMVAEKVGIDPAIMASSIITTLVDALSIALYFGIAIKFLPM